MMNEKRSVLKILEDAKTVSYSIAVMLVTSVIQIMGSGTSSRQSAHVHSIMICTMYTIPMYIYTTGRLQPIDGHSKCKERDLTLDSAASYKFGIILAID